MNNQVTLQDVIAIKDKLLEANAAHDELFFVYEGVAQMPSGVKITCRQLNVEIHSLKQSLINMTLACNEIGE